MWYSMFVDSIPIIKDDSKYGHEESVNLIISKIEEIPVEIRRELPWTKGDNLERLKKQNLEKLTRKSF